MSQPNALQGQVPVLTVKEIADPVVQQNFNNLAQYFQTQNQLLGFRFFDLTFTKATANFLVSHGFNYIPQDVITTKITGSGTVSFNYGLFDTTNINITVTGACRVRFLVGTYWNFITTAVDAKTSFTAHAALPSTAQAPTATVPAFTNPMTTLNDLIYGLALGVPARLPGPTATGQVLTAAVSPLPPVWAAPAAATSTPIANLQNFLVNSNFDFWQGTGAAGAGSSIQFTGNADGATAVYSYGPDCWYANNLLGGGTILGKVEMDFQQVGPLNVLEMFIVTAPTGTGIGHAFELYQVLSNAASIQLYNKTASFSASIKAESAVILVGLQFFYATTEAKPTHAIGSEVLCNVNAAGYTSCAINGQALGTAMTTAGVIGIRIRPTAVSSGNLYDVTNGFLMQFPMLNLGSTAQAWCRQNANISGELLACQYFYEKSWELTTAPTTGTTVGAFAMYGGTSGSSNAAASLRYCAKKRTAVTPSFYDTAGTVNKYSGVNAANAITVAQTGSANTEYVSTQGFGFNGSAAFPQYLIHWVADATI
jgi:hypothetical protein